MRDETPEERKIEYQRSESCLYMRIAAELDSAIDTIRAEIASAWARKDMDDRSKQMHEMQLNYCIKVLQKRRNERAEGAVDLWKQVGT